MNKLKQLVGVLCLLTGIGVAQTHITAMRDTNNIFTKNNQFTNGVEAGPVTFAHLSNPAFVNQADGTLVWVADASAQNPCAGAGSGAFAFRENTVWNCAIAGGGGGGSGTVNPGTLNHLAKNVSASTVGDSTVIDNGSTVSTTEPFSASTLTSTVLTGTPPITVTSATVVPILNVSQLLGKTWGSPGDIGTGVPGNGTFVNLNINGTCTGTACGVQFTPLADQTLLGGFNLANDAQGGFVVKDSANTTATLTMFMGPSSQAQLSYSYPTGSVTSAIKFNSTGAIVLNPPAGALDDGGHGVIINNSGLYIAGGFTDGNSLVLPQGNMVIAGGSLATGNPILTLGSSGVEGVIRGIPSSGGGSYILHFNATGNTNSISFPDGTGTLALTNSPNLTGTPTAPTGGCGASNQIATQAYVANCGTGGGGGGAVASVFTRTGAVTALATDYSAFYPLLTPAATQLIQPSSATAIALQTKCPASAAGTLACLQVLDNAGGNIVSFLQNDTVQIGSGVGGSITLTNVFGPNANPATAGQVAVSNTDSAVCWRNNANTNNLCLAKTSADIVTFGTNLAILETAAGSGIAGSGVLYEDSSTHIPSWSANNGSFLVIPRETGAMTSGHLVSVNATTNLIADSGLALTSVLLGTPTNHGVAIGAATQTISFSSAGTAGQCLLSNGASADPTFGTCPSASTSTLSGLTAAAAGNSINNADFAQVWNWQGTTSGRIGFKITENVASTSAGTPVLFQVSSIATSTMNPIQFDFNGNGIRMNTLGQIISIGTGGIVPTALTSVVGSGAAVLATGATAVTLDAEAASNVLTRPFYLEYEAACNAATPGLGSFDTPTSTAATASCFGSSTTQGAADFVDGSTTTVTGHFTLPQGWTGNMDARIVWFANSASSNAVRFSVQTGCVADTEAISTGPSYNTASQSNTSYTGTANQRKTTLLSAIPMTNCAAGETMYYQLSRIGGDAGDTLAATAEVVSLQFEGRTTK